MTEPRIALKDVSVSYFLRGQRHKGHLGSSAVGGEIIQRSRMLEIAALRDLSLTIRNGDRVGLIGRNGAGKSTFLRLCSGALHAQAGTVDIQGKVCPQFALGSGIRPALSGRRNAELKALYMGVGQRRIAEQVEVVKELSGLGGYFELPVQSYSAGMKSRLVMSMMQLMKGEILVMDEWINAADASVNETANALQKSLISSSSIVLIASHSNQVLREWTNRCIWFRSGRVVLDGPTEDVLTQYNQAATK